MIPSQFIQEEGELVIILEHNKILISVLNDKKFINKCTRNCQFFTQANIKEIHFQSELFEIQSVSIDLIKLLARY